MTAVSTERSVSSSECAVTLRRTDAEDVQQRQIYVSLDGGPTRKLLFGDTIAVPVAPGTHTLKANNTLYWKRLTFTLEPGQRTSFALINKAGKTSFGLLSLLGVAPLALVIRQEDVS